MKAIKLIPRKSRFLPLLLIAGILFLAIGVFLYFREDGYAMLDYYDVQSVSESVPTPVFSVPEGIYDQPFKLEIEAPAGYDIFYTTDGSTPTIRSNRYKRSITVDPRKNPNRKILTIPTSLRWQPPYGQQNHCIVFRARCFREGAGYGKTENVIYSPPSILQHHGFQIIHILIESDSLFSQERGIYVMGQKYYSKKARIATDSLYGANNISLSRYPANYLQRGKNWARPAEMILTDEAGKTRFKQNVLLRIHGNNTRYYPVRALRVLPNTIYGDTVIHYRFFNDLPYDTFKRILLRNSGNDVRWTMFRDAMIQLMVKGTGLDIQEYAPAVLYVNGNYWGICNIRESINDNYLEIKYGVALDNIEIITSFSNLNLSNLKLLPLGDPLLTHPFVEMVSYLFENSPADEEVYQNVCKQMDIGNFIDYMILETFFGNMDWPDANARVYRMGEQTEMMSQKNVEAEKWRWLVIDLDQAMLDQSLSANMFEILKNDYADNPITIIFFALLENPEFMEMFLSRYDLIIRDFLNTEKMLQYIEDFEGRYRSEMVRHIARWRIPLFLQTWQKEVDQLKVFARKRQAIVLEQLKAL